MKVLVTGGAGYIGSHTAQKLLAAGHEVVVYDNLTTGFKAAIPPGALLCQGDVRDESLLTKTLQAHGIQVVIHFAAKLIVEESITQPQDYYDNNVGGIISLAKSCRSTGVDKIVFSSTAAIYGNTESNPLTEDATPTPLNPYGRSKLMAEQILRDLEAAGEMRSVRLRYFNVAGAQVDGTNGQRTKNATHLIKVAAEAAVGKRESINVYGTDYPTSDGTCIRDYIHIEDLADLHVLALNYLERGAPGETFNCGYGNGFSVQQIIETMKKVSRSDFRVNKAPRRAGDAVELVADSSKAKDLLRWAPRRNDIELICRTAYEWEKKMSSVN